MLPVLVYGSIFTGIIIELVPVNTPLISRDLFSFSSLITWIVSACIAFGIIFCILWLEQKRKTFQFRNLQGSQKILLILAILALFTIGLLLVYPIDLIPYQERPGIVQYPIPRLHHGTDTHWSNGTTPYGLSGGMSRGITVDQMKPGFPGMGLPGQRPLLMQHLRHGTITVQSFSIIRSGSSEVVTAVRNQSGMYWNTRKNDVWYSADGKTWEPATRSAGLPSTDSLRAVVFDNKIWIYIRFRRDGIPVMVGTGGRSTDPL